LARSPKTAAVPTLPISTPPDHGTDGPARHWLVRVAAGRTTPIRGRGRRRSRPAASSRSRSRW
jgi:hypothetical protein